MGDCSGQSGAGGYLGKALSFKLELCDLASLPESCRASGTFITLTDAVPANWCANGASPCSANSWQVQDNFQSTSLPPTVPAPPTTTAPPPPTQGTPPPTPAPQPPTLAPTEAASEAGSGVCYINECGCPPF